MPRPSASPDVPSSDKAVALINEVTRAFEAGEFVPEDLDPELRARLVIALRKGIEPTSTTPLLPDLTKGTIFELIPKVAASIGAIGKDRNNQQQNYKFRGIEDFLNAVHPALCAHGVFVVPTVLEIEQRDRFRKTDRGESISIHVFAKVQYRFYASDETYIDCIVSSEGFDVADKATNKAMSAALKYALMQVLSVPTEDIADADRETPDTRTDMRTKPPVRTANRAPSTKPPAGKTTVTKEIAEALIARIRVLPDHMIKQCGEKKRSLKIEWKDSKTWTLDAIAQLDAYAKQCEDLLAAEAEEDLPTPTNEETPES